MFAKNYRKRSLFENVMAKIKRCSFFASQCSIIRHIISCVEMDILSVYTVYTKLPERPTVHGVTLPDGEVFFVVVVIVDLLVAVVIVQS